jgi:hypothetical protein
MPPPVAPSSAARLEAAPARNGAAAPDIVIHIGRIELKTAPAVPPPRPGRHPMTDLGDYLKGHGGGQ